MIQCLFWPKCIKCEKRKLNKTNERKRIFWHQNLLGQTNSSKQRNGRDAQKKWKRIIKRNRVSFVYIMTPFDFVDLRMSRHQTVEINIRSFSNCVRIERWTQTNFCFWHVCKQNWIENQTKKDFPVYWHFADVLTKSSNPSLVEIQVLTLNV